MKKKNKEEQQEETEIQDLSDAVNSFLILDDQPEPPKVRMLALYGEVDEESASELVQSLLILKDMGSREELEDPESEDSEVTTVYDPIDLIISTHGGLASEMYAIYDTIRMVRKDCDVSTHLLHNLLYLILFNTIFPGGWDLFHAFNGQKLYRMVVGFILI